MKRNNLKKSIYVGDTKGDFEASKFAGIPFIYASYGFGQVPSYDDKVMSISDIIDIVNKR